MVRIVHPRILNEIFKELGIGKNKEAWRIVGFTTTTIPMTNTILQGVPPLIERCSRLHLSRLNPMLKKTSLNMWMPRKLHFSQEI
jgi:hypothetical protein